MDNYRHPVSGFFVHRAEAEGTFSRLIELGLPGERRSPPDFFTGQKLCLLAPVFLGDAANRVICHI